MDIAVCAHAFRPIEPFLWVKQISDFFGCLIFSKEIKFSKKIEKSPKVPNF